MWKFPKAALIQGRSHAEGGKWAQWWQISEALAKSLSGEECLPWDEMLYSWFVKMRVGTGMSSVGSLLNLVRFRETEEYNKGLQWEDIFAGSNLSFWQQTREPSVVKSGNYPPSAPHLQEQSVNRWSRKIKPFQLHVLKNLCKNLDTQRCYIKLCRKRE